MYIGNDLQVAFPSYRIIDDISSGFNGSTTSFALVTNGTSPIPFPVNSQQVLISVNGVIQEPDPTGSAGFKLSGTNIVFSSAPANGHSFFGVILAGADYITAGTEFPDGSVAAPSFTYQADTDTGWYRLGSGAAAFSSNGVKVLDFDNSGLNLPDSKKIQLGTANDLQIYHDGSNSYIDDAGTGSLIIGGTSETLAKFTDDGSSELYYDNSKKFETTSAGVTVTGGIIAGGLTYPTSDGSADQVLKTDGSGNLSFVAQSSGTPGGSNTQLQYNNNGSFGGITGLTSDSTDVTFVGDNYNVVWDKNEDSLEFSDNAKLKFGTGEDLLIYHDGTNSYIDDAGTGSLIIGGTSETLAKFTDDGSVELYYDNSKKIETTSAGVTVTGGIIAGGLTYPTSDGSADQVLKTDGSGNLSFVAQASGGTPGGSNTQLQYNNNGSFGGITGLTSDSTDVTFVGDNYNVVWDKNEDSLEFSDNAKLKFGAGEDLLIYHDGSNSYIDDAGTGSLIIGGTSETLAKFTDDGSVELYHDNSKKLETTSTGITVTGTVTANSVANATNGIRKITASTSAPSGGSDGDLWVRYTA